MLQKLLRRIDDARFRRHVRSLGLEGHTYQAAPYPCRIELRLRALSSQSSEAERQLESAYDSANVGDLAGAAASVRWARWDLLHTAAKLEKLQREIESECGREAVLSARTRRRTSDSEVLRDD